MTTRLGSRSSGSCVLAVLSFLLASFSAPLSAQERQFGDEFVRAYGRLEAYCDTGTHFPPRSVNIEGPKTFERCVHRDGRYKRTERTTTDDASTSAEWSDGRRLFNARRYLDDDRQWAFSYQSVLLSEIDHEFSGPLERTILEWFWIRVPQQLEIREFLNRFTRRADLDRDGLVAYQAWGGFSGPADLIIWVSAEDGLIRRTGTVGEASYVWAVEQVRTNAAIARSDLAFAVPLRVRANYFTRSNPAYAAALISFGVFLLGMVFWRIRWIAVRNKGDLDDEDRRAIRNKTLRRYSVFAGILTLVLIVITALSAIPEGGHPPLAVIVLVFVVPIVCLLWLGLCFMVARHLVEIPRRATQTSE